MTSVLEEPGWDCDVDGCGESILDVFSSRVSRGHSDVEKADVASVVIEVAVDSDFATEDRPRRSRRIDEVACAGTHTASNAKIVCGEVEAI